MPSKKEINTNTAIKEAIYKHNKNTIAFTNSLSAFLKCFVSVWNIYIS